MSLTENGNGMVMPVGPMYGNGGYSNGMFADGSFWIIVLFLFALMGNGFGGWNSGGVTQNVNADLQRGFDQQSVMGGLNGITNSINSLAQGQCAGFANVSNGFAAAEIAANNRQMASMQQNWNSQTAIDQRLDTIMMNQQNNCFENRQAVADVKYTVANEAAATRSNTDAKVQVVLDKLCQLEMDGMKRDYENRLAGMQNQIDNLRGQLTAANNAIARTSDTATILADNARQTVALEQYLNPTPVPSYIVQNPNCCQPNIGFGCGCGSI